MSCKSAYCMFKQGLTDIKGTQSFGTLCLGHAGTTTAKKDRLYALIMHCSWPKSFAEAHSVGATATDRSTCEMHP
jgi:hypothetical protein